MSEQKNNTPNLRFPDFTGEWEEKTLGEVAKKVNRKNTLLKVSRVLTNSANLGVVDQGAYFDRDIAVKENTGNYSIVEIEDFVYNPRISTAAPVGPISINKVGQGIMSPLYTVFKFHTGCISFYEQYFQTTIWHDYLKGIANFGARFDRMNITTEGFFNMPLYLPIDPTEQEKIASCLSAMDELIAAQAEKVDALKEKKTGMMQQLFPRKGETTPRLRFPEFTGEWEEKKLGEVFTRLTEKNTEDNKNVLTISAQYGLISQLDFFKKSVAASDVTGYYLLHKGDFAYNKSSSQGKPVGAIKPLKLYDKGVVSTLYICFRCNNPREIGFWEQYFDAGILDKEIMSIAQEGARNHGLLNVPTTGFFELNIITPPSPAEQEKIADCLSILDAQITAETEKLTALKDYKKGLMQQLFPQPAK
jgi:type I restriction enzyme S subunit